MDWQGYILWKSLFNILMDTTGLNSFILEFTIILKYIIAEFRLTADIWDYMSVLRLVSDFRISFMKVFKCLFPHPPQQH